MGACPRDSQPASKRADARRSYRSPPRQVRAVSRDGARGAARDRDNSGAGGELGRTVLALVPSFSPSIPQEDREGASCCEASPSRRTQVSGRKSICLWVLSQKGLFSDSPQRQRTNQSPGGISNSLPSWSTSFAGP